MQLGSVRTMHDKSQDHNSPTWKFTFFGGTLCTQNKTQSQIRITSDLQKNQPQTIKQVYPLSRFEIGDHVVIQKISNENNIIEQLDKMHITLGLEATVISKTPSGSIILSIQNQQIGLGAEMASQVMVTLATRKR